MREWEGKGNLKREWRFMTHVLRNISTLGSKDGTTNYNDTSSYECNEERRRMHFCAFSLNFKNKSHKMYKKIYPWVTSPMLQFSSMSIWYNNLFFIICEHSRNSKQEHLIQWLFSSETLYSQSLTPIDHEKYFYYCLTP